VAQDLREALSPRICCAKAAVGAAKWLACVLLLRDWESTMTKILVPVDYSDHCVNVLDFAGDIARTLNAEVTVLYVWETMPHFSPETCVTTPAGQRRLMDLVQDTASREMTEFIARCKGLRSVPVSTHVDSGRAPSKILQFIADGGFDLVIVGTHGRGGVKHWALGSVAERLVRLSPVPVITVPERQRVAVASVAVASP
jgi:nucleotide-binding universal stress UspA family protein